MQSSREGSLVAEALETLRFHPGRGASHRCPPDWGIDEQTIPDYDLWLVRDGTGQLFVQDNAIQMDRGDVFLFRPGDVICARHGRARTLHVQYTHFLPDIPALFDQLQMPGHTTVRRGQIWNAFDSFFDAKALASVPPEMRMKSLVLALAFDLLVQGSLSLRASGDGRLVVLRALGFLRNHVGRTVRLDELCLACNVSRSTLSRHFVRHLGQTPMQVHTRMRLQRGHVLLRTGASVASVADHLGYSDPFSFSHAFKRETGWSPADVGRRSHPHEL